MVAAIAFGAFALAMALSLGLAPQFQRRLNRRRLIHFSTRPTSRALYTLGAIAIGLYAIVAGVVINTDALNDDTTLAALGAAAVATVGWIYTSHQSRRLSLINHTQDLIAQHRTSEIYEMHRRNVMRDYPVGVSISEADADEIVKRQVDKKDHWDDRPPIYYSIQQTLNFHEYVASGVRHDRLDEETIERYQKSILVGAVRKFLPLIRRYRERSKRTYCDIHWMIQYWYDVDIDDSNAKALLDSAIDRD
jgi:hypothetical protein